MKTYHMKHSEIKKEWILIDAQDMILGRLASHVAILLRGKNNPNFTPSVNSGPNVVIINAAKIALTGKKGDRNKGRTYYRHTGYAGGIKETTAGKILESNFPERLLKNSIQGMLPKTKLGRDQMRNLYVYSGPEHKQEAQQPVKQDFASLNRKNVSNKKSSQ